MKQFEKLSSKELAYQVVMPRLDTEKYFEDEIYNEYISQLASNSIVGFCVFGGNAEQVEIMTNELQNLAKVPLIFSADFEFGLPMRLVDDGTSFPHNMAIGKAGKAEYAYKIGEAIAQEAKSIGINWNFAPVADINSNKNNPIINIRSFGESSEIVSENLIEFIKGANSQKVVSCVKHFPGHGDTAVDSHIALPVLNKSYNELEKLELIPFKKAIEFGVKSIMIGHLAVPSLDEQLLPASLSHKIITNILINEMGYKGIIITDALDMHAISDNYSSEEAVIKALEAGSDIALMPKDVMIALENLENYIKNNSDFKEKIIASYNKIYNLKRWSGLIPRFAQLEKYSKIFLEHQKLALKVAVDALEIKGNRSLLPIDEKVNFAGFAYIQRDADLQSGSRFFTMLSQATENDCDYAFINDEITDEQIADYSAGIKDAEILFLVVFMKAVAFRGTIKPNERLTHVFNKLKSNKKTVLILLGNPYLEEIVEYDLLIKTFSDSFASLAAAVVKITGRESAVDY